MLRSLSWFETDLFETLIAPVPRFCIVTPALPDAACPCRGTYILRTGQPIDNQVNPTDSRESCHPVRMGARVLCEQLQFRKRYMNSQKVLERRQYPPLSPYLKHWAICEPLVPSECAFPPINHNTVLQIFKSRAFGKCVVHPLLCCPFWVRALRRKQRCSCSSAASNAIHANEAGSAAFFSNRRDYVRTTIKNWATLKLLVGFKPT